MVAFNRCGRGHPLTRAIRLLLCLAVLLSGTLLPSQAAPAPSPIARVQSSTPNISTRIDTEEDGFAQTKSALSVKSAFLLPLQQPPVNQACPLFGDADCDCAVKANDIQTYASHWAENNSSPAYPSTACR